MPEQIDFWCYSHDGLLDVFDLFCKAFPVSDEAYIHDCEDVWEWIEGETDDGTIRFNISRAHNADFFFRLPTKFDPDCPIRFMIWGIEGEASAEEFGTQLALALGLEVHFGIVEYMGGEDFEYRLEKTYSPHTD